MKKHIKFLKLSTLAFIVMISAISCTKKFEEINTPPFLITEDVIPPSMVFTNVLKRSIFSTWNGDIFWEYTNYYYDGASGTIFQTRDWSSPWDEYPDILTNISAVVRLTAKDTALVNQNAMARIWKVWAYQRMTDAYGDIPYFESALSPNSVNNQPKYDTQREIYVDMLKELKEAVSKLNTFSVPSFGTADILFGGNVEKWARFGNSLRLRLAIRVSYVDPELAKENIRDVLTKPLINDNSFNARLITLAGDANTQNQNHFYLDTINSNVVTLRPLGFTVTQELLKRDDPRLPIYCVPSKAGKYRGVPMTNNGVDTLNRYTYDSVAHLGKVFYDQAYPIMVMNAAEVYLIRAEAALRGLSDEDAEDMYQKGIAASLNQWNVNPTVISDYLSSPTCKLTGGSVEEDLENIIVQKYLATIFESREAWAEFRRTGYPKIWTGKNMGSTNGQIPRRTTYPLSEYNLNSANLSEAVDRLTGKDLMMSRIWWDAKPGLPFLHPKQGQFPPEMY
ncbi:MAG: SusD/RagB family nutrient-binding outer membrane lipoprotein [Chitinophagaceae bacterium]|nr:SusD/RagB family nutrient-binding outer membrane lipoprotein [Chitinophagaceae bacterium]